MNPSTPAVDLPGWLNPEALWVPHVVRGALEGSLSHPPAGIGLETYVWPVLLLLAFSCLVHYLLLRRAVDPIRKKRLFVRGGVHAVVIAGLGSWLVVLFYQAGERDKWSDYYQAGASAIDAHDYEQAQGFLADALASAKLYSNGTTREAVTRLRLAQARLGLNDDLEAFYDLRTVQALIHPIKVTAAAEAEVSLYLAHVADRMNELGFAEREFDLAGKSLAQTAGGGQIDVGRLSALQGAKLIRRRRARDALSYLRTAEQAFSKQVDAYPVEAAFIDLLWGQAYHGLKDDNKAKRPFEAAFAVLEDHFPLDHPVLADGLADFADSIAEDDPRRAADLYRRALRGMKPRMGTEDFRVAQCLYRYAKLCRDQGRTDVAVPLLRRALEVSERVARSHQPGLTNLNTRRTLWKNSFYVLAGLLHGQGKYTALVPLYERNAPVFEEIWGGNVGPKAYFLAKFGAVHNTFDEPEQAKEWFDRSFARRKKGASVHRALDAFGHVQIGYNALYEGDFSELEARCDQTHDIIRGGRGNHYYWHAYWDLKTWSLFDQDDRAGALIVAKKSIMADRERFKKRPAFLAHSLVNHGILQVALDDEKSAQGSFLESIEIIESRRQTATMSAMVTMEGCRAMRMYTNLALSFAQTGQPRIAWAWLEVASIRNSLSVIAARIAGSAPTGEGLIGWLLGVGKSLSSSTATEASAREAFRKALAGEYGADMVESFDLTRVQASLPADGALIAWPEVWGKGRLGFINRHWACIVKPQGSPVWVKLPGTGPDGSWTDQDNALCKRIRWALGTSPDQRSDDVEALLGRLYEQRLQPLEDHLSGVRRLIVLRSGESDFDALPLEPLADRWVVTYATSGTMLARLNKPTGLPSSNRKLFAIADPPLGTVQLEALQSKDGNGAGGSTRGRVDVDLLGGAAFGDPKDRGLLPRLSGTRREVELIRDLFVSAGAGKPMLLWGSEVTESAISELVEQDGLKDARYIHLATYTLTNGWDGASSAIILGQHRKTDAFEAALKGSRAYDGAIEVREILRYWRGRLNADLVTLSGCQTRVRREYADGTVADLAESLFLAGARSVLFSLWQTDETPTILLLTRFYDNILGGYGESRGHYAAGQSMSKADALGEAKRWVKTMSSDDVAQRRRELNLPDEALPAGSGVPYQDPYYWAGFILWGSAD